MRVAFILSAALAAAAVFPAGASASDACNVVSAGDAAAALGSPVAKTIPSTNQFGTSCAYRTAAFTSFVVGITNNASPSDAKSVYGQMVTSPMTQMAPSVNLPGIGDAAHRLGTMIYVLKGKTIYTFSLVSKDANGAGALRVIGVAKKAVAHLR